MDIDTEERHDFCLSLQSLLQNTPINMQNISFVKIGLPLISGFKCILNK